MRAHAIAILAGALSFAAALPASAQDTIRIGELNSYKSQPAFLEPYKKGLDMAADEINKSGGVLGKKLEIVSRDDGGNPGDAVRVAEELATADGINILCGTFLSNVGLAVTEFAGKKKVFFLAAEPLTDKITWANGNRYTFRLRPSTYMQVAMLLPDAVAAKKKRWALVYPNFEYGQSAAAAFKDMIKAKQPDVEFVTEQATPLGKIDAGAVAQAIDDAKPDAIFSALFGGDLTKFVREGGTRGTFKDRVVVDLLGGEPEYLDPLKDEAPAGWIVTGYPWNAVDTSTNKTFVGAYQGRYHDYPRVGSIVGYVTIKSLAAGIAKAGSTDTEKLVEAFSGLAVDTPFGPITYRASDHQATMGAFVGKLAVKDGHGTMVDFKYVDGGSVLPSDAEVKKLRPVSAD
ncbi:MAG TPA: ABC transporter substrate-binding protein [Xanthobacteraceae bacterium]|nr:ABC transporter substrate-binding protein [Xanthobacteraceae bacterium]